MSRRSLGSSGQVSRCRSSREKVVGDGERVGQPASGLHELPDQRVDELERRGIEDAGSIVEPEDGLGIAQLEGDEQPTPGGPSSTSM